MNIGVATPGPKKRQREKLQHTLLNTKHTALALGVSENTIRLWAKHGRLPFHLTGGGQRRFDVSTFKSRELNSTNLRSYEKKAPEGSGAVYCRVSSRKQADDLARQVQAMHARYPQHQVFTDVASGLNYKRRGLARLLDKVHEGVVKEVVVAHKDRLARFGVELIAAELRRCGASLVILDQENDKPEGQELVEDLTAVVHVFSCRLNGKRRYTDAHQGGKTTKKCRVQGQEHSGEGDAEASLRRHHGGASDPVPAGGDVPHSVADDLVAAVV